jgi:hypothetical protein
MGNSTPHNSLRILVPHLYFFSHPLRCATPTCCSIFLKIFSEFLQKTFRLVRFSRFLPIPPKISLLCPTTPHTGGSPYLIFWNTNIIAGNKSKIQPIKRTNIPQSGFSSGFRPLSNTTVISSLNQIHPNDKNRQTSNAPMPCIISLSP